MLLPFQSLSLQSVPIPRVSLQGFSPTDDRPHYAGSYTASPESSLNCPVLSPSFSVGTPRRLSIVSCRFVSGVCSGYTRWRPPLRVPAPPPTSSVGSGPWVWRSPLLLVAPEKSST